MFKGVRDAGKVEVNGNFSGRIGSFKELLGDVDITGDMSGRLLGTMFGDVTIQGAFSGQIGSTPTKAGTGNTLTVNGGTNRGVVAPADAFASYVGYP